MLVGLVAVVVVVVVVIVVIETAIWRFGADSRDGRDWQSACAPRRSPYTG